MAKPGGTIYAIGAGGTSLVKIGSTQTDVTKRLKTLQTGQPFVLSVLATAPVEGNVRTIETAVHRFLADKRQRGEWFAIDALDDAGLAQLIVEAVRYVEANTDRLAPVEGLAERVEGLRRHLGWSKVELARRSQLHQQHIYKVLAGERKHISVDTVIALARAFGVSTDYLLGLQAGRPAAPVPAPEQRIGTVRNVTHEYAHLETFAAQRPRPRKTTPVA